MGASQLLPRLLLAGPIATTSSAAQGKFRLTAAPAPTGGEHLSAWLAAALRCRSHGRHVGLAVATVRLAGAAASDSEEETLEAAAEAEVAAIEQQQEQQEQQLEEGQVLLEAWAPEAAQEDCCGLYEFEVSSGGWL